MRKDKTATKVLKTINKAARKDGILGRFMANLNRSEKQQLQKAFRALDKEFLMEKALLLKDTMSEILLHRNETPNILLQRNVWASLDAMALHLDYTGFTRAFQAAGPKMFRSLRLDDPQIVSLENQLVSDVMGGEAELSRLGLLAPIEVEEVIRYAEKHRSGPHGIRRIVRKGFTFQEAFANSCGRPNEMLDVVIHSPQAAKVVITVVLAIANAIGGIFGAIFAETGIGLLLGGLVFVATLVTIVIVVGVGC